jgi:hypothetical protein
MVGLVKYFPKLLNHLLNAFDGCRSTGTQKRTYVKVGHGVSHTNGVRCLHLEPIQQHPHHPTDCRPGCRTLLGSIPMGSVAL